MFVSLWKKLVMKRMIRAAGRARLSFEPLEDRATPASLQIIATSVEFGAAPIVSVFDAATNNLKFTVQAYESTFTGGVHVAVGDVNGDGAEDLITGTASGGGAVVKVFSGVDGRELRSFFAGDQTNRGGVTVASADFDNDGQADIVTGAIQNGNELIQVLNGKDNSVLRQYRPFNAPIAGVSVAAGDFNGDGAMDVGVGAGVLGAPRVVVIDGKGGGFLLDTFAFESTFRGGAQVAMGDINADGRSDLMVAAGPGGGPRVVTFSGATREMIHSFFAYDNTAARNGVQVSVIDVNRDGRQDMVTADGPGQAPNLRAFDGITRARLNVPAFPGLPVGAVLMADTTGPTATVTAAASSPTKTVPIPFTVTFSESVTGFTAADVTVTNGAVAGFIAVDARTYQVSVNPAGQGAVSVSVPAGAAEDVAGNDTLASAAATVVFDSVEQR